MEILMQKSHDISNENQILWDEHIKFFIIDQN
jgi:hypothetical protein